MNLRGWGFEGKWVMVVVVEVVLVCCDAKGSRVIILPFQTSILVCNVCVSEAIYNLQFSIYCYLCECLHSDYFYILLK